MATAEQTMMKVQRILTGPMGLSVQLQDNKLSAQFTDLSTVVNFEVAEWGETEEGEPRSLVHVSSPILWGVDPSPELFEWIARQGSQYYFGRVAAFDDSANPGKIFLAMLHTLLGDYLDEEELKAATWGVLMTADELDDELQQKFGGKRWADMAAGP